MDDFRVEVNGDLKYYFDKTASAVGKSAEHVEEDYIKPSLNVATGYAKNRPLAATFLAIFGGLSVLPVITFLGASVFVFAVLISAAIAFAFISSLGIILVFGSILLVTLFGAFLLSLFLTASTITLFLAYRLLTLVRSDSEGALHGAQAWIGETRGLVVERLSASYRPAGRSAKDVKNATAGTTPPTEYDSEGSAVVVKTNDAPVQPVFPELAGKDAPFTADD